jgi:hypothetical protein
VKPREYVAIESGDSWPDFDTYDRICKLYGWPQDVHEACLQIRPDRDANCLAIFFPLRLGGSVLGWLGIQMT